MGALADQAFSRQALEQAWEDVRANDLADAELSPGVRSFALRAEVNLDRLAARLGDQTYKPQLLRRVLIPSDSGQRSLDIPRVTDRVLARAILTTLTPIVDPLLGPFSYAYRPGLGVADAIQALTQLRDEGMSWVLRTDIHDCFPSIPRAIVRERLFPLLGGDRWLVHVIRLLLKRRSMIRRRRFLTSGLPQGCPLSPMLANLVLVEVDNHVSELGYPVVRYADDMAIAATSREGCVAAQSAAGKILREMQMTLGEDKTHIMSFDEGFAFLGEEFGARYPVVDPEHRTEEPDRKVMYAGADGARVFLAAGRFVVESRDEQRLLDVASTQVGRLVCFGSVGLSAGARNWLLSEDIDVVVASRRGTYLGAITSGRWGPRADRIKAQLAMAGTAEGLDLARSIVRAKISKQLVMMRRFTRPESAAAATGAITALTGSLAGLDNANSRQELMGSEGAAARAYFGALGQMVPPALRFTLRSRQPPLDVVNAALSYLYAILLGECVTAVHSAGLEPGIGVLHAEDEDRPSLALDLMEEFRPLVVDQVVLRLARQGALTAAHGVSLDEGGVFLNQEGKTVVVGAYELRMLQSTRGALPDFAGTIRRHLYRQAHRLRASLMDPAVPWTGLSWR